jgi:hypothetical protein
LSQFIRSPAPATGLASRKQKPNHGESSRYRIDRHLVTAEALPGEAFGAAPSRNRRDLLASLSALVVALALLAAMLGTVFEKHLVGIVVPQSVDRELYGTAAALTKLRFGIGGAAIDMRIFVTLIRSGFSNGPLPVLAEPYPENLNDPALLQSALDKAQTFDVPPPRTFTNANGEYTDFTSFTGEDIGIATYAFLAFVIFGVHISSLTYFYFVVVAMSLLLYGAGHGRSTGAMAAAVVMTLALYVATCSDFVNSQPMGTDVKDVRFLSTLAVIPTLHLLVTWTRSSYRLSLLDYAILALQSGIFAFALQIRVSTIWAMMALTLYWMVIAIMSLRRGGVPGPLLKWRQSRSAVTLAAVFAVLISAWVVATLSLSPVYAALGDVTHHTFWQGVLSSLQLTPEWKIKYGASVNGAGGDAMPAEVAHIAIMKLPPEERRQYVNSDGTTKKFALEKFSRIAFFNILSNDPGFVLHTFFVAKPLRIMRSEQRFFDGLFAGLSIWNVLVPVPVLLFVSWLLARNAEALGVLRSTAAAAPLFILVAWLPNWLIALNPLVMFDNFVWIVFFLMASAAIVLAIAAGFVGTSLGRPKIAA